MSFQSFETIRVPVLGLPLGNPREEMTLGCNPHGEAQSILQGGEWCLLPNVVGCVKLVLEVVPTKSTTPFPFNLH
jgi:hypothetical protein